MYKKTEVTSMTEELVAYTTVKSAFDAMAKRADRQLKPLAEEIYGRLKKKQKISPGIVVADTRFLKYDKARTLTEGIAEFKKRFPQYGEKLQGLIDETRKARKNYLVFGLKPGEALPNEFYSDVLVEIGVPESVVKRTLQTVLDISDILAEKKQEGLEEMLIK